MRRILILLLASALAAGCVDSQSATNGAVRFVHAVPDAPRMSLYVNDRLRASGFDYANGSSYVALPARTYDVRIEALLPAAAEEDSTTVFDEPIPLGVNDEVTLVVVGQSGAEEVVQVPSRTRGVPTGKTRLRFFNAAPGVPAVDVYVTEPDAPLAAAAPVASGLAYKAFTPQQDILGGVVQVRVTAPGDPGQVIYDSGEVFFSLESTLLVVVVPSVGLDALERPLALVFMTGTGSGTVPDDGAQASVRVANASPGAYTLDAFVNETSVDSERQECDPLTEEEDTLLEFCAFPYEYIGSFEAIAPGTYDVKVQVTGDPDVDAKVFNGVLAAASEATLVFTGLVSDTATATEVGLLTVLGTRRVATAAQLRIVMLSLAAEDAIEGDPTTDRIEIYITEPGADLAEEDPDVTNLRFGSDTGYTSQLPEDYQLTVAKFDTATPDVPPVVLLTQPLALAAGGVYTLLVTDSPGGVAPLRLLALDDDPAP
jgi:hypothetical protein